MLEVHRPDDLLQHVGTDLGHTDWMDVTQSRIQQFADATDDQQWIHTDPVRAAEGPFGGTIAHGFLSLSLLSRGLEQLLTVSGSSLTVNYGLNKVRFTHPVQADKRVRILGRIGTATRVTEAVQLVCAMTIEIEDVDKPACIAEFVVRFYRAGEAATNGT